MQELISISSGKKEGIEVFLHSIPGIPNDANAAFFGIIHTQKTELAKEILGVYKEASLGIDFKTGQDEEIFQNSLQRLNKLLAPFLNNKPKLNLFYGLKIKDNVLFSLCGNFFLMIVNQKKGGEVAVSTIADLPSGGDFEFFSRFAAGSLKTGQSLFISTGNITPYFTPLRLGTILASSSGALWQIKEAVAKVDAGLPFCALHVFHQAKILAPASDKTDAVGSIQSLLNVEDQTKKILSPPILPNVGHLLSKSGAVILFTAKILLQIGRRQLSKINLDNDILKQAAKKASIKNLPQKSWEKLKQLPALLTAKRLKEKKGKAIKSPRKLWKKISGQTKNFLSTKYKLLAQWFNALPLKSKIFVIIALAAILLFGQSILFLGQTQSIRDKKNQARESAEKIEQNIAKIKASLIYEDFDKAKEALEMTKNELAKSEKNPYFEKGNKNQFLNLFRGLENEIRRAVDLEPRGLFAFSDQKRPLQIFLLGENIYFLSDNSLLRLEKPENKLAVVYQNISLNFKQSAIDSERNLIFLANDEKIVSFDTKYLTASETELNLKNLTDLKSYGSRLYALAGDPLTISRLEKTSSAFARSMWLKSPADLSKAASLAVDGSIYVLEGNGQIFKFTGGFEKEFNLKEIDPSLSSPKEIFTSSESEFLYLFEPSKKRLAVFDKKGALAAQYMAENIGELIDFAVDEKNKKLYLLSENGIFESDLTHSN